MKRILPPRRVVLVGLLTLLVAPLPAAARDDVVRLVVPTTAGGSWDVKARVLAGALARSLDQPVIVDNRPGAAGNIAAEIVVRSPRDGRTLLMATPSIAVNTLLYTLAFDPRADLLPVVQLTANSYFLAASEKSGLRTVEDLQMLARSGARGINCGATAGTTLACEQLRLLLGARDMVTVPYPGMAPVVTAVMAGDVDVGFAYLDVLGPAIDGGKARLLAATGDRPPAPPFDRVPTLAATWPQMVMNSFEGVFVAGGTPPDVVAKLNREFNAVFADPKVRAALTTQGNTLVGGAPDVMAKTLADSIDYYRRVKAMVDRGD